MGEIFTAQNLVALLTLLALEVVLGIDNVIFISILSGKLPESERARARSMGIGLAVISRILLLLSITWVMRLQNELFLGLSGRDLILIVGGLFLIGKSTFEIHEKLETADHTTTRVVEAASLTSVLIQIILIDVVFSLDSVITAIGLAEALWVMIVAILIAAGVMVLFAGAISSFVERHPTMKILALAFLILIGTMLVIEGWNPELAHDLHLKNYAYFAMAFAFVIELINLRIRKPAEPVVLHNQPTPRHLAQVTASAPATTRTQPASRTQGGARRKGRR